jgi:hypothetical protein
LVKKPYLTSEVGVSITPITSTEVVIKEKRPLIKAALHQIEKDSIKESISQ